MVSKRGGQIARREQNPEQRPGDHHDGLGDLMSDGYGKLARIVCDKSERMGCRMTAACRLGRAAAHRSPCLQRHSEHIAGDDKEAMPIDERRNKGGIKTPPSPPQRFSDGVFGAPQKTGAGAIVSRGPGSLRLRRISVNDDYRDLKNYRGRVRLQVGQSGSLVMRIE